MSHNIGTDENPILVFVRYSGGMIDAVVRATDEATFEAAARWAELRYELTETVTDEETGETTTQGTGEWATSKGVYISPLGPVVITPGVYTEDGTETTAPVLDTRYHVNVRLASPAVDAVDDYGVLKWEKWAMAWTAGGVDDTQINANEVGKVLQGVSLIDPETINTPSRVWL